MQSREADTAWNIEIAKELTRRANRHIETGRVCAVCGKTTSPSGQKDTYGFGTILRHSGIHGRDKAHRDCVAALQSKGEEGEARRPLRRIKMTESRKERMAKDIAKYVYATSSANHWGKYPTLASLEKRYGITRVKRILNAYYGSK